MPEGPFAPTVVDVQQLVMAGFRQCAVAASDAGFVGAFPNFYERPDGIKIMGGTIYLRQPANTAEATGLTHQFPPELGGPRTIPVLLVPDVEWRDVRWDDLGQPDLNDFGDRMRKANAYASGRPAGPPDGPQFVAAFPTCFEADYGQGLVCGTVLLGPGAAEWRDVPLAELGNPSLDDIILRFQRTQDYATQNGFVGGFPNMFDADYGQGRVCGTVLVKPQFAELGERVVFTGPK